MILFKKQPTLHNHIFYLAEQKHNPLDVQLSYKTLNKFTCWQYNAFTFTFGK